MTKFKVVGLRDELYIGEKVSGHNCDFDYTKEQMVRHVLLLKRGFEKFEVSLWETNTECYSGWTTATKGNMFVKKVAYFAGKTHTCNGDIYIDVDFNSEEIENEIFTYSYTGEDDYYPCGGVTINYEHFTKFDTRGFTKRPVLIFYGDSNAMKSHIAALTGKTVFETDYEFKKGMPDFIDSDIVVIGNKYKIDIEDVKGRLGDVEIIEVNFKRV